MRNLESKRVYDLNRYNEKMYEPLWRLIRNTKRRLRYHREGK
jgi:hypothetical protein